ncbi:LCP family protein [Candidatus Chlorohelix sp.]|uniref:LCP family protein n=1 Tax=Candidatus Chlorohelix sp. TaxID=3139201 RepID=UPI003036C95C
MAGDRQPDRQSRVPNNQQPTGNGTDKEGNQQNPNRKPYQPFPEYEYRNVPRNYQRSAGRAPIREEPHPEPKTQRPSRFFVEPEPETNMPSSRLQPKSAPPRRPKTKSSGSIKNFLFYCILILVATTLLGGLYFFSRVTNIFNGISVPRIDNKGNVVQGSNVNGNGLVNILLLGLDSRNDPTEGIRSDTLILVSINQGTKKASMLSIPRDLWVDIPGYGKDRINSAYFFGDQNKPGQGGPPLIKETIARNFGIQIDYFAQVDFEGFREIIDAIGGITIDIKKPLIDAQYPTEAYGYKRVFIPAGLQFLNGETALEYARSRHSDSDLGRNQRQQDVLLAVREKGVNLGLITNDKLIAALQHAIKTDLQWNDILSLAQTAIGMDKANIRSYAIDANMTKPTNINKMDVLVPDWTSIHELVKKFNNA